MPGLFGTISHSRDNTTRRVEADEALHRMAHAPAYIRDPLFSDEHVVAGRTHPGIVGEATSPASSHGVHVWVEGEIYNASALARMLESDAQAFPDILAQAESGNILEAVLRDADGSFVAVIYNSNTGTLRLASDRHGTRPLYILDDCGNFAWASELKAFMALIAFSPKITREAVSCFMDIGHMVGNLTWFKGVTLIPAATVITHDIATGNTCNRRYWSWGNITRQHITIEEAIVHLGRMIDDATSARYQDGTGIGLSGGLDSRTLLAASPEPARTPCYTFGVPGCWDIVIARQAAAMAGAPHTAFEFEDSHWYDNREADVIRTDGMQNLLHMHASPILPRISELLKINLNGFFGDVIGGYFQHMAGDDYCGKRADAALAERLWGRHGLHDDPDDAFYDIDSPDPYVANNRMRRFSVTGSINHGAYIEQRYPFLDNGVVEFVYGLPDEYRRGGRLYHTLLLKTWPRLFRTVPWQSTGVPIGGSTAGPGMYLHKLRHIGHRIRLLGHRQSYTDYARWIRMPHVRSRFRTLLDPDSAIYPDYVDADYRKSALEPHLAGRANNADMICRALTLEVWLRYVNGRFGDSLSTIPPIV